MVEVYVVIRLKRLTTQRAYTTLRFDEQEPMLFDLLWV
jgi:hypothetical protein